MPNIKSQKDRVVQAAAEQAHNKAIKTNLKTVVKKADAAIDANAADKDATVLAAVSAIDKARAKGVIKKNTASRKISRMAKRANKNARSRSLIDEQNLCTGYPAQGFLFFPPLCPAQRGKALPLHRLQQLLRRQRLRRHRHPPRRPRGGHKHCQRKPRVQKCRLVQPRTAGRQHQRRAQAQRRPQLPQYGLSAVFHALHLRFAPSLPAAGRKI